MHTDQFDLLLCPNVVRCFVCTPRSYTTWDLNLSLVQPCWAGLRWKAKRISTPGLPDSGLGDGLVFNLHKESIVTESGHAFQDSQDTNIQNIVLENLQKMYGLSDTYADVHIKFFLMKFWSSQKEKQGTAHSLIAGGIVMRRALSWQQSHKGFSLQFDLLLQGSH